MKKIGILTFHRALNYGAVLQSYALVKTLKKIESNNIIELIDYRNEKIEERLSVKSKFKTKNLLKAIASSFLLVYKKRKFSSFVKQNITISNKFYDKNNIIESNDEYDVFITGSDQVWNTNLTNNDFNYMLDFCNKERFSYAASIGVSGFNNAFDEKVSNCLKKFNTISVREVEASCVLEDRFLLKNVRVDLDPALLLEKEEWNEISSSKKNKGKYVLTYNVTKPECMYEIAKMVSKKQNIGLKCITSGYRAKYGKVYYPNVKEFISLFRDAEYVITNSFHGTVFSIIFHKKFIVELNSQKNNANSRILTLLSKCGLMDRIYNNEKQPNIDNDIDWSKVDKNINEMRESSLMYLKELSK